MARNDKPLLEFEGRRFYTERDLKQRVYELEAEHEGEEITGEAREEWNSLNEKIDHFEARRERVAELARSKRGIESGDGATTPIQSLTRVEEEAAVPPHVREARDAGLRAVERHSDVLGAEGSDRLDTLIRRDDPAGLASRYLAAVGNPDYKRAFAKIIKNPADAHLRMTREEQLSVQEVVAAEESRAMAEGTGSTGGFGIPIEIDPTINILGAGALNPVRKYATVRAMSTLQLRLVSADQVTAAYVAEATEATDNSPTLAQPILTAAKGHAFIPFSFELEQDYLGLTNELGRV
jgi:HK97 family phage major capsid protein